MPWWQISLNKTGWKSNEKSLRNFPNWEWTTPKKIVLQLFLSSVRHVGSDRPRRKKMHKSCSVGWFRLRFWKSLNAHLITQLWFNPFEFSHSAIGVSECICILNMCLNCKCLHICCQQEFHDDFFSYCGWIVFRIGLDVETSRISIALKQPRTEN